MSRSAILFCLAILCAAGCQRQSSGVLFELSGRIFVFNYRVATANYLVTLRRVATIPEGSRVTTQFENPRGGEMLATDDPVFAADDRLALTSPFVECVRKDRPYRVHVRLIAADGRVLQEIDTSVTSDTDQSVLPTKPLVVGPTYTPNPEVFKSDGSADYGDTRGCPD